MGQISDIRDDRIAELKERVAALEGKSETTEEALRKMTSAKPAHEEVKSGAGADVKFRSAHDKFLYELNKSL